MQNFWDKIMRYKEITAIVVSAVALTWVALGVKATAESNTSKIDKQQTSIDMLTAMVMKHDGSIETTLTMLGVDPEKARKWSKMPKAPVTDTLKNPILGVDWVVFEEDMKVGLKYQFQKNGDGKIREVFVDTLYDVRETK